MSYYEKNATKKVRERWEREKASITDRQAVTEGDEITSQGRPTWNTVATLLNILTNAPRDENSREIWMKVAQSD